MEFNLLLNGQYTLQSQNLQNNRVRISFEYPTRPLNIRIPPNVYLDSKVGLFLGVNTPLLVNISGRYTYVNLVDRSNCTYELTDTIGQNTLSMMITGRVQPVNNVAYYFTQGSNISFQNLCLSTTNNTFTVQLLPSVSNPDGRIIYSVAECGIIHHCNICAPGCPVDFTCFNEQCNTAVKAASLGIRYGDKVITVSPKNEEFIINGTNISNIYPNTLPPTYPIDRWFFTDLLEGDTNFIVGRMYPLYIIKDNKKIYLSPKPGSVSQLEYIPKPTPDSTVISFKPTKTGQWRDFVFTLNDFDNLPPPLISNTDSIALWQNFDQAGRQAVVRTQETRPTPTPVYKQAWFWIILVLFIVIITFLIVVIYKSR